jgi:hypothetical protein
VQRPTNRRHRLALRDPCKYLVLPRAQPRKARRKGDRSCRYERSLTHAIRERVRQGLGGIRQNHSLRYSRRDIVNRATSATGTSLHNFDRAGTGYLVVALKVVAHQDRRHARARHPNKCGVVDRLTENIGERIVGNVDEHRAIQGPRPGQLRHQPTPKKETLCQLLVLATRSVTANIGFLVCRVERIAPVVHLVRCTTSPASRRPASPWRNRSPRQRNDEGTDQSHRAFIARAQPFAQVRARSTVW